MNINLRELKILLDNIEQILLLNLFLLYITPLQLKLIDIQININEKNKQTMKVEPESDEFDSETEKTVKP